MSEEEQDESYVRKMVEPRIDAFVDTLLEHVDSVVVFCTWTEAGTTHELVVPGGNIYATLQQVTEWRLKQGIERALTATRETDEDQAEL